MARKNWVIQTSAPLQTQQNKGKCTSQTLHLLNALMKANSKLRHLSLHSLPRVTDYTDIFLECNLQNLEVFFASHCPGFYDRDMDVLKSSCPKMKMHKIIHCGTAYTNCRCFTKEPHAWSLAA
jgi:hypothetical protein